MQTADATVLCGLHPHARTGLPAAMSVAHGGVRNFRMTNGRPCRPTRSCLKMIGRPMRIPDGERDSHHHGRKDDDRDGTRQNVPNSLRPIEDRSIPPHPSQRRRVRVHRKVFPDAEGVSGTFEPARQASPRPPVFATNLGGSTTCGHPLVREMTQREPLNPGTRILKNRSSSAHARRSAAPMSRSMLALVRPSTGDP